MTKHGKTCQPPSIRKNIAKRRKSVRTAEESVGKRRTNVRKRMEKCWKTRGKSAVFGLKKQQFQSLGTEVSKGVFVFCWKKQGFQKDTRGGMDKQTDIHIIPYHREGDEGIYRQIITDQVIEFSIFESVEQKRPIETFFNIS